MTIKHFNVVVKTFLAQKPYIASRKFWKIIFKYSVNLSSYQVTFYYKVSLLSSRTICLNICCNLFPFPSHCMHLNQLFLELDDNVYISLYLSMYRVTNVFCNLHFDQFWNLSSNFYWGSWHLFTVIINYEAIKSNV